MTKTLATVFSRILFVLGGLAVIFFAYDLVQTLLAPVAVPPAPPAPTSVRFDPKLDVTKNGTFGGLRPVGPADIVLGTIGRANPFIPVPTNTPAEPLQTLPVETAAPTTTVAATSSPGIPPTAATGTAPASP